MDTLSHILGNKIKGVIEGFDRIVFNLFVQPGPGRLKENDKKPNSTKVNRLFRIIV